jgi:diguanylate cyclase (GGDEF)-like protein
MGGEEFCIVLSDANPRTSRDVAERIRTQIEAMAIPTASGPIRTTVSAGIAYSTGTESIRSLLMRADEALYEAKSAVRNRVQTHDLRHLAA